MSRRSEARRQARREKQARRWSANENAPTRDRRGVIADGAESRVSSKPFRDRLAPNPDV